MITTDWQKAQRSGTEGNCAEIRRNGDRIEIRNSKDPNAGTASFTEAEWSALTGSVRDGQFDF